MLSREHCASPKSHGDAAIPGLYSNCLKTGKDMFSQFRLCVHAGDMAGICMLPVGVHVSCMCACIYCVFMCVEGTLVYIFA